MEIKVNGKKETFDKKDISILDFIQLKGQDPEKVVVEYNKEIVDKQKWSEITLKDGDLLEILKFVGGG